MGIITAGAVFLADFLAKDYVNDHILQGEEVPAPAGPIYLENVHTDKVLLGTAEADSKAEEMLTSLFMGGIGAFFLLMLGSRAKKLRKAGASLLFGGALNNYLERRRKGYVTKYIGIRGLTGKDGKGSLNLSDLMMVLGAVLCLLSLLGRKKK